MMQIPIQMPNMGRRPGNAGLDERVLSSKVIDTKNAGMLLPFLFPREQSGSDENLSSDEKRHQDMADKDVDIEAGNMEKEDEQDSDSEDSQPEEEAKMLDSKETHERGKSKNSNKNSKSYNHESDRRNRDSSHRSKYVLQDETILKHLFQETSESKTKSENEKKEVYRKAMMADLGSSLSSCYPELTRLLQGDGQTNAREIATQTSLPLDILEMEELKQSIDEIINSRHCSSKGTQISPQLKKSKNIVA